MRRRRPARAGLLSSADSLACPPLPPTAAHSTHSLAALTAGVTAAGDTYAGSINGTQLLALLTTAIPPDGALAAFFAADQSVRERGCAGRV